MNKEKMQDIKERLDLFPDNMNKPAQEAYYELFDYIKNLEQALDDIEKICNSIPIDNSICGIGKIHDIEVIIQKAKGDGK